MASISRHQQPPAGENLSAAEAAALLSSARTLQRAAASGRPQPLLRGKNLGLLCDDDARREALLFRRAATELGARVAHIRNTIAEDTDAQRLQDTARMLGRLYDAVECEGLPHELVEQLAADAGVPVYDGSALPQHPTAALADQLDGEGAPGDKRVYVLQALLVRTIG